MRFGLVTKLGLLAQVFVLTLATSGCGGGGGGGSSEIVAPEQIADYTFSQPRAGMVLSAGTSMSQAYVDIFMRGSAATGAIAAYSFSDASDPSLASSITAVNRSSGSPFQLLTVTGTGFRTTDSATSVIFRADGLEPIAVPVIAATSTTVQVAIPALIADNGDNVAGHATVQVYQTGDWGYSITAAYNGLDIGELPQVDSSVPAGSVVNAYLTTALTLIDGYQALAPGDLPTSFWTHLASLESDLSSLQTAVQQVIADPSATPTLPSSGANTVTLDAASLALADRLVAALLLELGEQLDFVTTDTLPTRATARAVTDCPALTTGGWVDDFMCSEQQFKQKRAEVAPKALMLGVKIETSIYLGLFGGVSTNMLGLISAKASTAFELVWSAVSGHITAWFVGGESPTAGETLGEVGVTVLENAAGTHGLLSAALSAAQMGKETDALVVEARTPTTPVTGTLQGNVSFTATETGGCQWRHALAFTVTVSGFGGNGTLIDPYTGTAALSGTDTITVLSGADCDPGGVISLSGTGSVEGDSGKVDIAATGTVGSGSFTFDLIGGTYDGTAVSGPYLFMSDALDAPSITGNLTLTRN